MGQISLTDSGKRARGKDELAVVKRADGPFELGVVGRNYHFIGAGGIGMSGLAKLLLRHKGIVSGSDCEASAVTDKLQEMGATVYEGHSEDNLPEKLDAVVVSAAVKDDNPEFACARKRGVKVYKYAELLGELIGRYDGISVCGTHGKSTASGWLSFVLDRAGVDPSWIVGAEVPQLGDSNGAGSGRLFVAEACEYDRSFLNMRPKIAVMLNIEQDHLDYYKDEGEIIDAFAEFAGCVKPGGTIVANGDDANVRRALDRAGRDDVDVVTFGLGDDCDFSARRIAMPAGFREFDVFHRGRKMGHARILLPGEHNIYNALAVAACAWAAGVAGREIFKHISKFEGMDRRLMLRSLEEGVIVMDDYAHHPTEIRASLKAMRERYDPKMLWCIFQPHQYSRTRFFLEDFANSFKLADITIVPEIYFVRDTEQSRQEVNSEVLVERIREQGSEAIFIDSFDGIVNYLKDHVHRGDLVVTMGAGDIWKVADEYIRWLMRSGRNGLSVI